MTVYLTDQHSFGRKDYVGNFSSDTSSVTFFIDVPVADKYDVIISSAAVRGNGHKLNYVLVNGKQIGEFETIENNVFAESVLRYIHLNKGKNEIKIAKSWGWIYMDYIYIRQAEDLSAYAYNVSPDLVNPGASGAAKRLMKYIVDNYGKKTLSCQTSESVNSEEFKAVYSVTGKYPAVMALDMMDYSPSRVARGTSSKAVENAVEWHNKGGIVKFLWHWNAPKDLIDSEEHKWWSGFYTNAVTFNLAKAISKEDLEGYNLLLRDIDAIAVQLKRLRDLDIPVLWRPLHEASGGWFWWGASGNNAYKQLWILMYERMTNYHGLNNLIWIWNGGHKDWFPGADYVDLAGEDIYTAKRNYSSQSPKFYEIVEYLRELGTMKPIGLTECGPVPGINEMERDKAMWFMFAPWNGEFVRKVSSGRDEAEYSEEYTEAKQIRMMYNDRRVITLNDLPDFRKF
jgi:mannan endo-1,4-beta-mannosidase